jgi:hypothetical protein
VGRVGWAGWRYFRENVSTSQVVKPRDHDSASASQNATQTHTAAASGAIVAWTRTFHATEAWIGAHLQDR